MKLGALSLIVVLGCAHPAPRGPSAPAGPAVDLTGELAVGPATAVVSLSSGVRSAVLRGPFLVTTINPGGGLTMALATRACDEPGLLWFDYSGSGVAVAANQILCVTAGSAGVQAFSGRHEAAATP